MRPPSLAFRLCATTVFAGLLMVPTAGPAALAQPAPPAAAPGQPAENPPERVGWLQQISGGVSFHAADAEQWSPAAANYPLASGDALWTEQNASARALISASVIATAGGTELDITTLDANGLQTTLPQGEIYLHLRGLAPSETWSAQTPRGLVTFAHAGRYGVTAGDTQDPTTVTVLEGSAQISGPGFSLQVAAGQTASVAGAQTFQASVGMAQVDAFLAAKQQAEQALPAAATAAPAVVTEMPGGDDLSSYGTWSDTTANGQVWYPQVAAGWVPYREGHWAYVPPWGWTWIDDDPWGFAPFHYGRWAQIGGRWGWMPGAVAVTAPPVYAPALVAFFGVGIDAAIGSGTVGWFPLGPHEPYHPWYRASDGYLQAVNRRDVTDVTVINRNVEINQFVNRSAVTAVPAAAMAESQPVRQVAVRVDPRLLASARPVVGTAPIRPTVATAGFTPNLARQMHLPTAPRGAPVSAHVAPGPAIHAAPLVHGVAARPPLPPLPQHPAGAAPHGQARPAGVVAPALRRPGEVGPPPIAHPVPGAEIQQHGATPAGVARPGEAPAGAEHRPPAGAPQPQRVQEQRPEHPASVPQPPGERPAAQAGAPRAAPAPEHASPAAEHAAPHPPPPEAHPAPAARAPEEHVAPPVHAPAPEVHAPPPAHALPPEQRPAPPVHAPAPEVHAPPPKHAPEPVRPAPPPQAHPAPAPHPGPAEHEKKPGQP